MFLHKTIVVNTPRHSLLWFLTSMVCKHVVLSHALVGSLLWFCFQESILTFCKTKEVNHVNPHLSKKHTSEWGFPGAVLRLPRGCPGRMAWIHIYGFQACGAVARPGGFTSVVLV